MEKRAKGLAAVDGESSTTEAEHEEFYEDEEEQVETVYHSTQAKN